MKEQLVRPFLKAMEDILMQITGVALGIGTTKTQEAQLIQQDVAILIGVTGELEGQTIINLEETLAKQIASSMMGGMAVNELDDLSKSAVAELGNMILGNAAINLYNEGCKIDITPPTLLIKEKVSTWEERQPIVMTTFNTDLGRLEMNLALKSK